MHFSSLVKWLLSLVALSLLLLMAAAAYFFSHEDYAPERGSLSYYIGISGMVRGAPLIAPVGAPAYFGSVGDGNKPPQSEVSYETDEPNASAIWLTTERYLNQHGFDSRDPAASPPKHPEFSPEERVVQQGEFTSKSGELIVVVLTQTAERNRYKVRISHFD
jgi:hypothetical protein